MTSLAFRILAGLLVFSASTAAAQAGKPGDTYRSPGGATLKLFLDDSNVGPEVSIGELTFPPNADSGDHTHGAIEMFYVLSGELEHVVNGKSYVLSARILDAKDGSELLALRETAADDAGIVAALDRLSGRVRERIGESLRTIRGGEPLEQVTTGSLEALRAKGRIRMEGRDYLTQDGDVLNIHFSE